jgi:hypothetical protein
LKRGDIIKKAREKIEPLEALKDPNLIEAFVKEYSKRITREKETIRTLFILTLGGSLVENAEPTSSNLMINDETGAGKDFIARNVFKLFPNELIFHRKRISETSLTYWKHKQNAPDFSWSGKVLYLEDISNNLLNSDVFKVMSSSKGGISTITKENRVVEYEIIGKPIMIITTYSANPKKELLRRFPILNLDISEEQTKAIIKNKVKYLISGEKQEYNDKIKELFKSLERCKVSIPYAEKLTNLLSTKKTIVRTHFDRFADYIKFSCAVMQHQREKNESGYLQANKEDYDNARIMMLKTTSNIFSIPLANKPKHILETMKNLESKYYSITELEKYFTMDRKTLKGLLDDLTDNGFLEKDNMENPVNKRTMMVFRYTDDYKITIPTWEELDNCKKTPITPTTPITPITPITPLSKETHSKPSNFSNGSYGSNGSNSNGNFSIKIEEEIIKDD